ncbi:MAG: hypothetical protein AB7I37_25740 [Pirellulales bacterium]
MRVVKLGGSLLGDGGWVAPFRTWLHRQSPAKNLLVVGGGEIVEHIRRIDRQAALPAATSHWLAIRAMQFNAELAAALLEEARIVLRLEEFEQLPDDAGVCIADPWTMLRDDCRLADLPHAWSVTSDSIAARLAAVLRAQELVLLKSCLPPSPATREGLAAAGYVDEHFVSALAGFGGVVRCVNLRGTSAAEKAVE